MVKGSQSKHHIQGFIQDFSLGGGGGGRGTLARTPNISVQSIQL